MNKDEALKLWKRDESGLVSGVEHIFNEDGSINWRAMIKPKFLYPNREWFENRRMPIPDSNENLEDHQLCIQLGGVKELAKLRGFTGVYYRFPRAEDGHVSAICTIKWLPNFETDNRVVEFEDSASASSENTDSFGLRFLETMACNRAFVRCVRNFLNIHIVGVDEIYKEKKTSSNDSAAPSSAAIPITPQGILEKAVVEKLAITTFKDFKVSYLRPLYKKAVDEANNAELVSSLENAKDWKSFKDIPAKVSRLLLKIINEND